MMQRITQRHSRDLKPAGELQEEAGHSVCSIQAGFFLVRRCFPTGSSWTSPHEDGAGNPYAGVFAHRRLPAGIMRG